jgi:hypothetical protein
MINAADISSLVMTENPTDRTGRFDFGLTTERAAQYLAELFVVYWNRTKLANRLEDAARGLSHLTPSAGLT